MGIPDSMEVTKGVLDNWLREQQLDPQSHYVFHISGQDDSFAGLFGLRLGKPAYRVAEIWYKFHPAFWGRGYATEAVVAILALGFNDLQLHRIEAGCAVDNIASIRVLEKAGMQREGRCRKILPIRGEWHDNYIYAILEEDFIK
ncbi:MAG: N-acetyltransferase [Alcaligenaceae bacterium]|nr:MAG: N-acetyltransferase [Alcaligenaceae bacterium]